MMKGIACLSIVLLAGTPQRVMAAWLTAVKPLPGYKCAILDITDAQAQDPAFSIPILTRPDAKAPVLSGAAGLVIVHAPEVRVNSYLQVLAFSGQQGWIASSAVRPYAIPGRRDARCVPSLMSNGRVGFGN